MQGLSVAGGSCKRTGRDATDPQARLALSGAARIPVRTTSTKW